jgi:hypothetical protein
MTEHLHPNSITDLALAPLLISIERNLIRLRDSEDLAYDLALALNDDDILYHAPLQRAGRLQRYAVRNVDLHGWTVSPTMDLHGLAVSHGEYTVSVMLGRRLVGYVTAGSQAGLAARPR